MLCAAEGQKTLTELGGRITVRMPYTPPAQTTARNYYVVFRDGSGKLRAIRASYSRLKGEIRFETDRLGEFEIIGFDYQGEGKEFSDDFYLALEDWMKTQA